MEERRYCIHDHNLDFKVNEFIMHQTEKLKHEEVHLHMDGIDKQAEYDEYQLYSNRDYQIKEDKPEANLHIVKARLIDLPLNMPRLDQLPKFQKSLYRMTEKVRNLLSGNTFEKGYFLYTYCM